MPTRSGRWRRRRATSPESMMCSWPAPFPSHRARQLGEQIALEVGPLGRRLDHQVTPSRGRQAWGRIREGQCRRLHAALLHPLGQPIRRLGPRASAWSSGSWSRVRMPAAQPSCLSRTHRAGAHHAENDLAYRPPNSGLRFSRKRSCPRRGRRWPSPARTGALVVETGAQRCLLGASTPDLPRRTAAAACATPSRPLQRRLPSRRWCATRLTIPNSRASAAGMRRRSAPAPSRAACPSPGQPLGPAAPGDDSEQDLGLPELGRLGGHDQSHTSPARSRAAQRIARNGGDHRPCAGPRAAPKRAAGDTSASWQVRAAWP